MEEKKGEKNGEVKKGRQYQMRLVRRKNGQLAVREKWRTV